MEWNSHDQEKKGKDGEIGVLVGVLFWMRWGTLIVFWLALFYLNGILSVFGIWDAVFVTWWIFKFDHKNMIICVFILWINFAQSSLFHVFCGKSTPAWKSTPTPLQALLTNMSYGADCVPTGLPGRLLPCEWSRFVQASILRYFILPVVLQAHSFWQFGQSLVSNKHREHISKHRIANAVTITLYSKVTM